MKYKTIFEPEQENWCLPASLQTILKRRELEISQSEISESFEEDEVGSFLTGINELKSFFKKYGLKVEFYNPFLEPIELDIFLPPRLSESTDVLIGYDFSKIHKDISEEVPHISHVLNYQRHPPESLEIADFYQHRIISTQEAHKAIHPDIHRDYGFYIIN
jgi:hypothetical protein